MALPHARYLSALALTGAALLSSACTGSDSTDALPAPATTAATTETIPGPSGIGSTTPTTLPPTTSTTLPPTTTSTTLPPTTTTEPLVVEGAVVMVANSADVPGAAARLSDELTALGFVVRQPTNGAIYDTALETSKIYAREEASAVAQSVSRALGGVPVERMPTPAPIRGANETLGDATVLVMLGADLVGRRPG